MELFRQSKQLTSRLVVAGLVCWLVVVVGCGIGVGSATAVQQGEMTDAETLVDNGTADPTSDRLGWENGVWANATLSIDQSDGINQTEQDALVARTMARIEAVRGLEFERTPPVRILFQEELQAEFESGSSGLTTTNESRILLNQQYEALFLIDESSSAVDSRRTLYGTGTNGLYDPETGRITMVSPNQTVRKLREGVLAQELFHAQQDDKFKLSSTQTIEQRNTRNSYVEGDANYVQDLYEQRCENDWDGTCYLLDRESIPDLSGLNDGMARLFRQPYQSGYAFVRDRHQRSGWEAVNELYEQPPASTEQVIHPEAYRRDEPTELRIADRSTDEWEPLTANGERVTESVGEPGLFVSLLYPALQTAGDRQIIPFEAHQSGERRVGSGDELGGQLYSYAHPLTTGWDGDRLLPYVSTNGSQRGYVYETAWDSPADAREFHEGYRKLLAYHGADAVPERSNTYRLPADSGFEDAIYINRTGSRLRIVNGPSVDAVRAIRRGAAPDGSDSESSLPWERVRSAWESTVNGDSLDAVVVQNGVAYTQDNTGTLSAVDGETGQRQWQYRFETSFVSPPTLSGETLYVGTAQQRVVAVDAKTGEKNWTRRVSGPVTAAPTVVDDIVYAVTARGTLHALDRATGQPIWPEPVERAATSALTVHDGAVVVPRTKLSGIDTQTGDRLWEADIGGPVLPELSVANETAFATSLNVTRRTATVHAVDTNTAESAWRYEVADTARVQQTVVGQTVFVSTVDALSGRAAGDQRGGNLLAIDRDSGELRWRLNLSSAPKAPVVSGQTVYVGTAAGRVHAVDTASGSTKWSYSTGQRVTDPPIVDNQTLYVGTQSGVLSALNATTGRQRWTYITDGLRSVSPAVGSDTVYANGQSTLTALESTVRSTDDQTPPTTPNETDPPADEDSASGSSAADESGAGFGVAVAGVGLLIVLAVGRHVRSNDER